MAQVPCIDLTQNDANVASAIQHACTSSGFFLVRGHGVPDDVVAHLFEQNAAFFGLPDAEKQKIRVNEHNRGWTPIAEEILDPTTQREGDTKEGLYFGREIPADSAEASLPLHGPNQWPSEEELLRGYRTATTKYFDAVTALGWRLLRLLALSLNLEATWFDDKFESPMILLRPLHYTSTVSRPAEGIFGAGAHSDYGCLTILRTDGSPGLQIFQEHTKSWQDVPHVPGSFVVNIGDMTERWTNGKYKSTMHRVVNTTGKDRYSCAFFFEPTFTATIEVIPSCCSPENPPKYAKTTSGEHLLAKYAATHSDYNGGNDCS